MFYDDLPLEYGRRMEEDIESCVLDETCQMLLTKLLQVSLLWKYILCLIAFIEIVQM